MRVSKIWIALLAVALCAASLGASAVAHESHHRGHGLNDQDRTFLKGTSEGAKFEVLGGMIARHHHGRERVEKFGKLMISDHSREFRQVLHLAHELGVHVSHEPSPEQKAELRIFSKYWGKSFDCVYISNEWNDHETDIAEAELELAEGHNDRVKDFARYWLKVYEEHDAFASSILLSLHDCGAAS
jgi:putative membrane protein